MLACLCLWASVKPVFTRKRREGMYSRALHDPLIIDMSRSCTVLELARKFNAQKLHKGDNMATICKWSQSSPVVKHLGEQWLFRGMQWLKQIFWVPLPGINIHQKSKSKRKVWWSATSVKPTTRFIEGHCFFWLKLSAQRDVFRQSVQSETFNPFCLLTAQLQWESLFHHCGFKPSFCSVVSTDEPLPKLRLKFTAGTVYCNYSGWSLLLAWAK